MRRRLSIEAVSDNPVNGHPPLVIVIDDDPGHTELLRAAFDEIGAPVRLEPVADGARAIGVLRAIAESRHEKPGLILLDLRMPCVRGQAVLALMRQHVVLGSIPTVIMTSSSDPSDRELSLEIGARDYIVKPPTFVELTRVVRDFVERYLGQPIR